MKNVPTIGKFLAIMAAFGVFALAVAAYSGLQMWNIDKGYSALNDQEMMPSIMVTRGDGALETARSAIADLMISTTDAGNRAALDTLAAATKEFQSTMDSAIAAAPKDADTLRALKSRGLDALGQECANAVKQGLASHTASENAASQQVYLNECAPKFPALSADMRRQVDVMTTTASKGNDALTGTTKGTIGTTFALILGGLAVVMTGGFFAVRALVSDPLKALAERMRRLAGGDLDVQVEGQDRHDEVGAMAKAVQVFKDNGLKARAMEAEAVQLRSTAETERERTEAERRRVEAEQAMVVKTLAASLGRLAQGDLSSQIDAEFNGQYLQIKTDFNAAVQSLAEAMSAISGATGAIRGGSDEIAQASDDLSRRTEQQAASLEETAAALDQITATVKRSAEGAKRASGAASTAKGEAQQSGVVMRDAVTAMGEIEESSGKITQIIGVIDEIAFQTNLLALNAGVEAARAGDAGKGFAVVASEVRALAQRSADAAKEIKTLIASSSSQVERGVKLVGDTGQALTSIVAKVTEIDTLISEIALSSQEQATGLAQVNTAVNQMDQVTQQNAAMVEQATAAASNLRGEAGELAKLVSRFRVAGEPARGRPEVAQPGRHQPAQNPVARAQARIASSSLARKPAPQSAPAQDGWEEF